MPKKKMKNTLEKRDFMRRERSGLNYFASWASILSLLLSPQLFAQSTQQNGPSGWAAAQSISSMLGGLIQEGLMSQAEISKQKYAQFPGLNPNAIKPQIPTSQNGAPVYFTPMSSPPLPGCPRFPSVFPKLQNADEFCGDFNLNGIDPRSPSAVQQIQQKAAKEMKNATLLQAIGDEYISLIDSHLESNESNLGLSCMENYLERLTKGPLGIQERANKLKSDAQKFQEILTKFKNDYTNMLKDIQNDKELINGDGRNINDYLRSKGVGSCIDQGLISSEQTMGKGGLQGLRTSMIPFRDRARQYAQNKSAYEEEIRSKINILAQEFQRGGLSGLQQAGNSNPDLLQGTRFSGLNKAFAIQQARFENRRAEIQKALADNGYTGPLPAFDQHFATNLRNTVETSSVQTCFSQKKIDLKTAANGIVCIKECDRAMTKASLAKIRQEVSEILNNPGYTTQEKISKIQEFENNYHAYNEYFKANLDSSSYKNLASALQVNYNDCVSKRSIESGGNASAANIQAILSAIEKDYGDYGNNLRNEVVRQVLTCEGLSSTQKNQCSPDSLSPESDNFCLNHATQCTNKFNDCHNKVSTLLIEQKNRVLTKAANFNRALAKHNGEAKAIFNSIKQRLLGQDLKMIQAVSGSSFNLDVDLTMPEMRQGRIPCQGEGNSAATTQCLLDNELKLEDILNDGGDLSSLDALPEKLTAMAEKFEEQIGPVTENLNKEMQDYREQLENNRKYWQDLRERCKGQKDGLNQQVSSLINSLQGPKNEAIQKAGEWCKGYKYLNCSTADKLAEEAGAIAAQYEPVEAIKFVHGFREKCAEKERESKALESFDEDQSTDPLVRFCATHSGANWKDIVSSQQADFLSEASTYLKSLNALTGATYTRSDLQSWLNGKKDLPSKVKKTHAGSFILAMRESSAIKSKDDFSCEKLNELREACNDSENMTGAKCSRVSNIRKFNKDKDKKIKEGMRIDLTQYNSAFEKLKAHEKILAMQVDASSAFGEGAQMPECTMPANGPRTTGSILGEQNNPSQSGGSLPGYIFSK